MACNGGMPMRFRRHPHRLPAVGRPALQQLGIAEGSTVAGT
jgi:hypothetical protein